MTKRGRRDRLIITGQVAAFVVVVALVVTAFIFWYDVPPWLHRTRGPRSTP